MKKLTEDEEILIMERAADMADREVVLHYAGIAGFDTSLMQKDDKYFAEAEDAIAHLVYIQDHGVMSYTEEAEDMFLDEYDSYHRTLTMIQRLS